MNTQLSHLDNSNQSPLVREFAMYIKDQHAAQKDRPHTASSSTDDADDYEEPIMVRSFFYRIMRIAFVRNGYADDRNSDFINAATAYQWAALDATDFRNLNRIDRNLCTHCAGIICSNPSPFYLRAMQNVASDVLAIAHSAIRADKAQRRPQPVSAGDGQGVLALAMPEHDQHPAIPLDTTRHSHQR
jgi:hypothetical protein